MPVIDSDGLFSGERLCACSLMARLYWPYFYAASNGYARLELSYASIVKTAFRNFDPPPAREEVKGYLQEYADNFLLFIYKSPDGTLWGQWDTDTRNLPRHKTRADLRSPAPDDAAFRDWIATYRATRRASEYLIELKETSESFGKVPKLSEKCGGFPRGIGIGIGIVQGKGKSKESTSARQGSQADSRFKPAIESIKKYWDFKNPGTAFVWDQSEGKQLKRLLGASPQLSLAQIQLCLQHRARSDVAHTDRPRMWLENLLSYANGPLDKFGKPKELEHGSTGQASNAQKRQQRIIENTRKAFDAVRGGADRDADDVRGDDGGECSALREGAIEIPGTGGGGGN